QFYGRKLFLLIFRLPILAVDLIMQETFAEVDWTLERMVVLACGHILKIVHNAVLQLRIYIVTEEQPKKHVLDIQNKKFLMKCEYQLKEQNRSIKNATAQLENKRKKILDEIKMPPKVKKKKEMNIMEKDSSFQAIPEVIPTEQYILLEKYHIPTSHEERWNNHISVLLAIYRKLMRLMLATKSPPYKLAYEAA
ncbi:9906_t:CDS:2, partial [Racocetra fulgida]